MLLNGTVLLGARLSSTKYCVEYALQGRMVQDVHNVELNTLNWASPANEAGLAAMGLGALAFMRYPRVARRLARWVAVHRTSFRRTAVSEFRADLHRSIRRDLRAPNQLAIHFMTAPLANNVASLLTHPSAESHWSMVWLRNRLCSH